MPGKYGNKGNLGSLLDKIHFHQLNNVYYNSVNINAVTTFPFLVCSQQL